MADVLVVDDEEVLASAYSRFLVKAGHSVRCAPTGESALESYRASRPDLILLDVRLPDMTGFDVYAALRHDKPVVIMISGHADVPLAVRALQEGVENFLTKPTDFAHLRVAVDRALEKVQLRHFAQYVTANRTRTGRAALGSSPSMAAIMEHVSMLASTDKTTVLILGEGGTGKGRIAEMIHAEGSRASGPFVPVHCRASDADALEKELFGDDSEGDSSGKPGLVELAVGGTLFLDEVADLPISVQARVLRMLEHGAYRRVGGRSELRSDVRIVAASARDLIREVDASRLREDLYYRLSVMPLRLPPLRERSAEDVVELVSRLMEELEPQLNGAPRQLSEAALGRLLRHHWPGNIRELRNVLERAMILSSGREEVDESALPLDMGDAGGRLGGFGGGGGGGRETFQPESLDAVERAHIERTLRAFDGNRTHASRALGVSRATLIKKIQEYGLSAVARR